MKSLKNWEVVKGINSSCHIEGEVVKDNRYNPETEEFRKGHRIITSPVVSLYFRDGIRYCITENNTYILE